MRGHPLITTTVQDGSGLVASISVYEVKPAGHGDNVRLVHFRDGVKVRDEILPRQVAMGEALSSAGWHVPSISRAHSAYNKLQMVDAIAAERDATSSS